LENSNYNSVVQGMIGDGWSQSGGGGGAAGNSTPPQIDTQTYRTIIVNQNTGGQTNIESSDSPVHTLSFTLSQSTPLPNNSTTINIDADVYSGTALKYKTEYETGYITGKNSVTTTSTWIKFERQSNGEQYKSVVSALGNDYTNKDVQLNLNGGSVNVNVLATKNDIAPGPNAPTLTVSDNQFSWNINDSSPLSISYTSSNSDYVEMSLGGIKRQLPTNGVLTLSQNELNRIGGHTLYLQSVSNRGGSSSPQTISINVIQKTYLPGPDITNITYPSVIKGKDFVGFDVEFDISWASINTNFIDVYVGKVDSQFVLGRFSPAGKATFNVNDVLKKSKTAFNEDNDKIEFKLLLVPTNIEGDSATEGKVEEITLLFDKGDLKLRRGKVVSDIRTAFATHFNTSFFKDEISNLLTHYLHFGEGDNKLIATWGIDTETFATYEEGFDSTGKKYKKKTNNPKSLVLKLYEPLPTTVQENQTVWISKVQSIPMIEQISIVGEIANNCTPLTPNFDLNVGDDIGYQILDDLIASGSTTSTDLINTFVSSSEFSLDNLDIQFISTSKIEIDGLLIDGNEEYWWSNFVKYSSAKERVDNFMYKIGLLEFYTEKFITASEGSEWTGSVTSLNEINSYKNKISKVKNDFDAFEKFLYFESSSLSYPGAGQTQLSASTDDSVSDWYGGIITSAEDYDTFNKSNLVNNLPQHIQDDENGQEFILFFNMIGQHFDILWTHIKGLQQSKKLEQKYESGIKDELVYHMLESLGWDADMGVQSQYLWEYAFGKHSDGTQVSSMSGKDRQSEIWRRLLNNLPYLNKHKGTKRALHAAMACYGIPASLLTIMEFGGPQDPSSDGTTQFTFEDRTAALNLSGSSNIVIDWKEFNGDHPNSIEFRINTTQKQNQVIAKTDGWKLEIESGSNYLGRIKFSISGSDTIESASTEDLPIFYDDFYHIALNKTISNGSEIFDLYVKEGFNGRIRNSGSLELSLPEGSTSWKSGSELKIGGTYPSFTGSIDEIRLWTTALSQSRIENHTLIPDGIDGNHISASTHDLIFRNDFEYPKNRGIDVDIKNVAYIQAYQTSSVANNFESIVEYPYNYIPYDRDVTANVPSSGFNVGNKFRFETQYDFAGNEITSNNGISLDYKSRSTKKSYDNSPIDTDRLGLFFSPVKEINMDILKSLGNFNIDDYIGNPQDEYNDRYSELDSLRKYYFQRFDLNFNEYIQLVRYIDKSLFDTLESLVPARAKVASGLLIEPHILERSKVKWNKPKAEKSDLETVINTEEDRNIVGTFEGKEVTLKVTQDVLFDVTNPQYEGTITDTNVSDLIGENIGLDTTINTNDTSVQYGFMTINSGSDMGGISIKVDATFTGSIQGQYDSDSYIQVGMDPNSITNKGFGVWASGSHSQITELDLFGNLTKTRKKIFQIKEQYKVDIPQNINLTDPRVGTEYISQTLYRQKVTILDWDATNPIVGGDIVEVTPLNGYFPSHYRNVGDLSTGLENSYFNGSKQTQLTTLDGGAPVVTFTTNPNTLKVNDTGRGSGEPILMVE
jgi:hypothetical protein